MTDIARARREAIDTILGPKGKASQQARKAAYDNRDAPAAVRALLERVANAPAKVSDEDVAAAKAQGLTEDEIFELVVCAAAGQASRQYEGALAALAEATKEKA